MTSFIRVWKFALQNFVRNFWLSTATLLVIMITLMLINVIVSLNELKFSVLTSIQNQIDISLDFKPGMGEAEILRIKGDLERDQRVRDVAVVTPDENLQRFTARYPQIGERVIPVLDGNPLGYTLQLHSKDLEDYDDLLTKIQGQEFVKQLDRSNFNDYRLFTSKTAAIAERINMAAIFLASVFLVIAIIIIFNTIRVSIYTHRDEIAIMKLVGAGHWFIRLPFMIEALLYSLVATVLLGLVVMGLLQVLQPSLSRYFTSIVEVDLLKYYSANWPMIFGLQLVGVSVLNIGSSLIALRKYLRL